MADFKKVSVKALQPDARILRGLEGVFSPSEASAIFDKIGNGAVQALCLMDEEGRGLGFAVVEVDGEVFRVLLLQALQGTGIAVQFIPVAEAIGRACGCKSVRFDVLRAGLVFLMKRRGYEAQRMKDMWLMKKALCDG